MEEAEDGFLEHTAARESGQWAQMRAAKNRRLCTSIREALDGVLEGLGGLLAAEQDVAEGAELAATAAAWLDRVVVMLATSVQCVPAKASTLASWVPVPVRDVF